MNPVLHKTLFNLDPEQAHDVALTALGVAGSLAPARLLLQLIYRTPSRPVTAFGLKFKNPVGLAAGYDKDARAVRGLATLGFGHIEVGTVTPMPQKGNPRPRLFRLPEDEAIINRMGFPSRGSAFVQRRLSPRMRGNWIGEMLGIPGRGGRGPDPNSLRLTAGCVVGVSIGKNAATSQEDAVQDYLALLQIFAMHADYIAINVSSPNTQGLRALQQRAVLEDLLNQLHIQRRMEQERIQRRLPLLVKLSPDLDEAGLDEALEAIVRTRMDGVILTNTTTAREGLRSAAASEQGGLSGAPLRARSEALLQFVVRKVPAELAVVSSGGIMDPEDVKRRLDMGAALVQLYTGLIYRGPGVVRAMLRGLRS